MRVLSPDACGATRRHQRIHACAECHGARVLERPQGTRALQYCEWTPTIALRTECSTTPKWRRVINFIFPNVYYSLSNYIAFKQRITSVLIFLAGRQYGFRLHDCWHNSIPIISEYYNNFIHLIYKKMVYWFIYFV